jgi:hypothetical protein
VTALDRLEQKLQAGKQSAATVRELIDRIETRAYERGWADARTAGRDIAAALRDATAGIPPAQPAEHPILRKARGLSLRWGELGGVISGIDDMAGDPLTREDLHAYRREWEATHGTTHGGRYTTERGLDWKDVAQRPQTGQGDVAAPLDAQGQPIDRANGGKAGL